MDRPPNVSITITPNPKRVRIHFNAHVIADTSRALKLSEGCGSAIQYVPREDVHMFFLERTFHRTYCPLKGDAVHYTIIVGGRVAKHAAWTYEEPYPAVPAIKGYLAFYPERVDRIEELPRDATPDSITAMANAENLS